MRVKELSRWLDSFGMPSSQPWAAEPADWSVALNLLARLLHPSLAQRVDLERRDSAADSEPSSAAADGATGSSATALDRRPSVLRSTNLAFQETMELVERVLGAPQFTLVADLKQSPADNQLALFVALCALHFAVGPADTKPYRDFQFAFRIYFDMDLDGSSRLCHGCAQPVHLIERLVLNGRPWHRNCLKCCICGRQLYRGAFHFAPCILVEGDKGNGQGLPQCVEHFGNAVLFGDPKHRLALPPTSGGQSLGPHFPAALDKRASMVSSTMSISSSSFIASPPPRPPPPKIVAQPQHQQQLKGVDQKGLPAGDKSAMDEEESIERKIALAAAAQHDLPVPRPRKSLQQPGREEKSSSCWEVLEYPEELNPFGWGESEKEGKKGTTAGGGRGRKAADRVQQQQQKGRMTAEQGTAAEEGGVNPFESEEEEDGEEGLDMLLASPKPSEGSSSLHGSSACPSPAPRHSLVQSPEKRTAIAETTDIQMKPAEETIGEQPPEVRQQEQEQQPNSPPKPPRMRATAMAAAKETGEEMVEEQMDGSKYQYIAPLGPMPFRLAANQLPQQEKPTEQPSGQPQQSMYELDIRLRKLHAQLDQWEITGARMEKQLLRELMAQKEKDREGKEREKAAVWRKDSKLANDFGQLVEQRCAALVKEGALARRYMDAFLAIVHPELDRQMKDPVLASDERKRRQFGDLLAQLLHIRNELTELERREREAKGQGRNSETAAEPMAVEAQKKKRREKETEKEVKEKEKDTKSEKRKETGQEEGRGEAAAEAGEAKENSFEGGGDKEEKAKGHLLKKTLRMVKKKL